MLAFLLAACCAGPGEGSPDATRTERSDPVELLREGRAARDRGEDARARELLERAVAADPGWAIPRLELSEQLLKDGAQLERVQTLLAGADLPGEGMADSPRFHHLQGQLRELQGNDAGAVESYARSLALRAEQTDLRLRYAQALSRLGRKPEAIAELERVRVDRPGAVQVLGNLADLYEEGGHLAKAEAELQALVELSPDQTAPLQRLARFYERHEMKAKAKATEKKLRAAGGDQRKLRPLKRSRR
jgi:predicted Zn-dependent protease